MNDESDLYEGILTYCGFGSSDFGNQVKTSIFQNIKDYTSEIQHPICEIYSFRILCTVRFMSYGFSRVNNNPHYTIIVSYFLIFLLITLSI
jgi:hypothetical protein